MSISLPPLSALVQVNTDALHTLLLSLHPESKVKDFGEASERTRAALKELHPFKDVIHLNKLTKAQIANLTKVGNVPSIFPAQLGENKTQDPSHSPFSQP